MAHEIEDYLLETFNKGASTSSVHPNQLRRLNNILNQLNNSTDPSFNITDVRDHLYHLNNLLNECQRLSSKCPFLIFTPRSVQSYREVGKSLEEVRLRLEEEYRTILDPGSVSSRNPPPVLEGNVASRLDGPSKVHGFKEEVIELERMVLARQGCEEKFKAIGVAGIAGVGKTTLCKELLKLEKVRNHFVPRIHVQLCNEDTKKDVIMKILESLGLEKETVDRISNADEIDSLVCAMYAQLMGKRYLIVLDNVFGIEPWYEDLNTVLPQKPKWGERLAYGLPKGYGGTVLVTGRDRKVIEKMVKVEENVRRLQPLADKDSTWNIIMDAVGVGIDETKLQLNDDVKEDILKKCAGVPLAAKTIGEIMSDVINELLNARNQEQIKNANDSAADPEAQG